MMQMVETTSNITMMASLRAGMLTRAESAGHHLPIHHMVGGNP